MIEVKGDLFAYIEKTPVDAICFTTNKIVKANGELVMGAGVAKVFRDKFPKLAKQCGSFIKQFKEDGHIPNVFIVRDVTKGDLGYEPQIVYFATKDDWKQPSTIELIEQSLKELVKITNMNTWENVVLPRPGCNNGELDWKQVKPLCERYLNDRFVVITK